MEKCIMSWWQEEWLISLIPIVFTCLGWGFKTWWESRKPYKKDQELFEEIQSLLDNSDDYFIENIKHFTVGNAISEQTLDKLHNLRDITFNKPEYYFNSKKVRTSFNRLKESTVRFSNSFIEAYTYYQNCYVPNQDFSSEKRTQIEQLYTERNDEIATSQDQFINAYDNFIKIGRQKLYTERIDR